MVHQIVKFHLIKYYMADNGDQLVFGNKVDIVLSPSVLMLTANSNTCKSNITSHCRAEFRWVAKPGEIT